MKYLAIRSISRIKDFAFFFRSFCLQTAFAFVDDHNNCNFSKEYAENILDESKFVSL